jgi:hypothetical protein
MCVICLIISLYIIMLHGTNIGVVGVVWVGEPPQSRGGGRRGGGRGGGGRPGRKKKIYVLLQ